MNLTVKADGSSRRLGGYGRVHEALRGSGGFHEAPGNSAIMNLTVKAYGSAGGSGRLQSGGCQLSVKQRIVWSIARGTGLECPKRSLSVPSQLDQV